MITSRWAAILLLLCACSACGGSGAEAAQPAQVTDLTSLPPAPDLSVRVEIDGGSTGQLGLPVRDSLTSSLTQVGYKVLDSGGPPPDFILTVRLSSESVKKTIWNGMSGGYKVKVTAEARAFKSGESIDQTSTEFTAAEGKPDEDALRRIVVHFAETKRLQAFADRLKAAAADKDDAAWKAANVEECRAAISKSACRGVKAYAADFPSGKHAEEAQAALKENVVAEEESAWKAADVARCKKPAMEKDCALVEAYLKSYPNGKYAADASAALKATEGARAQLKKQEEAKAKAEDREDCVKSCRRKYEAYSNFEAVVSRCVQNNCT